MSSQPISKYALLRMSRRSAHYIIFGWLNRKGKGRKSICHKIYPEYMDWQEGNRQSNKWCEKEGPYLTRVCGAKIFPKLSFIIVYLSSFFYCFYNCSKIV